MFTVFIGFDLRLLPKSFCKTIVIQEKKHIERQIGSYILITFVYLSLGFLEKASQGEGVIYIKVVFTRLSKRASQ